MTLEPCALDESATDHSAVPDDSHDRWRRLRRFSAYRPARPRALARCAVDEEGDR
jgi:hypothetical protein